MDTGIGKACALGAWASAGKGVFMASDKDSVDRRNFLKGVAATGLTIGAANTAFAGKTGTKMTGGRVIGANDRINVGVIGCGGRGSYVADQFTRFAQKNTDACRIAAVSDVYEKRKRVHADLYKVKGYLDYRELR